MNRQFSREPDDPQRFTTRFDALYSRTARLYDLAVRHLPVWKTWLARVLPCIQGPRVLEVSFGTGYLLSRYASDYDSWGVDINSKMIRLARENLERVGVSAHLCQASVEALPYLDGTFNTVVNTMAFSGYPRAEPALGELVRVMKPDGRLVMIDINYPERPGFGDMIVNAWQKGGDLIRDMAPLFKEAGLSWTDQEIGGFGSVHLYVCKFGVRGNLGSE